MRAYRGYARLNHGDRARPWLYRIATRSAYTEMRKRRVHAERSTPFLEDQVDDRPGPSSQAERKDLLVRVRSAIRSLPPRQRAALFMRKYQGMSYEEVGKALDCKPEAARAHVYQALRRLRARFPAEASQEVSQR